MENERRTLISFDWALKSILRQKDNFDILENFLSILLNDDIKIISLLESEANKGNADDKFNRVDLRAKDGKEREIIIEVQHSSEPNYGERVYYGTCKSVVDLMQEGFEYGKIAKIISVSILYFDITKESYVTKGSMKFEDLIDEKEVKDIGCNVFADYYFIQPNSKLFHDKIKKSIDEWVYFFKHTDVQDNFKSIDVAKVESKLNRLKMTPKEQRAYHDHNLDLTIKEGMFSVAREEAMKKGHEEGIKKGRKEGIKEGKKEGRAEGIKEGRKEGIQEGINQGKQQAKKEYEDEIQRLKEELEKYKKEN